MKLRIFAAGLALFVSLGIGGTVLAQGPDDDGGTPTVEDAEPQTLDVEPQSVFDEIGAWADGTWKTAALFAIQVMVVVSAVKTFFWAFLPSGTEDRIKEWNFNGLRPYSLGLLAVIFAISWVMVVSNFDWYPWADSPLVGVSALDANIQNAMTAALITAAAGVEHEIVTGIGAFFRYLKDRLADVV